MAPNTSKLLQIMCQEESIIIITAALALIKQQKNRWWVHDIIRRRAQHGAYHHLFQELLMDAEKFQPYMRLSREQFQFVFTLVEEDLVKHSSVREVICPKQRLAVCLRYLATGESFHSLAFSYRMGVTTVSRIVSEVSQVIWQRLATQYMKLPNTEEEWALIAANFDEKWQFPHCLGALDGKHVVMKCPGHSGSVFFNYKGSFSIVLLALVDANLKFIAIDVGAYGRNSDGGIFANSNLGKAILRETLHFPDDRPLHQAGHLGSVPYVVVADEAFPLQKHIMRPFPGRGCPEGQRIFNYRLSRARRIVENAFGVLASRWRLYHTKLAVKPQGAIDVVKATCVLHNFLQSQSTPAQITTLLQEGEAEQPGGIEDLAAVGNRAAQDAVQIRDTFKEYFVNVAPVSWQEAHVNRGHFVV